MSPLDAAAILALAAAAAFTQAVSGFGFSLLLVPPLALLIGPREAVVAANGLGVLVYAPGAIHLRRAVDVRLWLRLIVAAAAGMPVGLLILVAVSPTILQVVIAVTVITATLLIWRGVELHRAGWLGDALAGFVSGVSNTSTSMSGPPVVLYLQGRGVAPDAFRATLAAFFLASGGAALALYALSGRLDLDALGRMAVGAPGLAAGWVTGNAVYRRLDQRRFRRVVFAVLLASAAVAIATALAR